MREGISHVEICILLNILESCKFPTISRVVHIPNRLIKRSETLITVDDYRVGRDNHISPRKGKILNPQ